jgi:glucose-1-phosphate adenylyltransferase
MMARAPMTCPPKPALPFAGQYRVIDFALSNCIHSQLNNIAILIDYQRWRMAEYLKRWCQMNGNTDGFHILQPQAGSYSGTADAVYKNIDFLQKQKIDTVLILAGDHVYKMDYRQMLAFHQRCKADVTIGVTPVTIEQAYRFGIVTADAKSRVVGFVEKPTSPPQSNLASMGIYVFNKQVLVKRLIEDAALPDSPHDFGYAVIPGMLKRDKAYAYQFAGYWQDIGTKEAYYEANMELTHEQSSFSLDGSCPVLTASNLSQTTETHEGSIKNSIISPGCVIHGEVENSVLSPGVSVDKQAVVRNSVLMANVVVGCHSVVDRCILDEGVRVGDFCHLGCAPDSVSESWEVTVVGKGVTVPSGTAISQDLRKSLHIEPTDSATKSASSGPITSSQSPFSYTRL